MKGFIKLFLLTISLGLFCGTVSAQSNKQRLTREQLAEVQAKHIAEEMAMDEETEQVLKARFAHSQKILDLRQKYYGIYSEFLTQQQIRRVYELERQIMERLSKRGKRINK